MPILAYTSIINSFPVLAKHIKKIIISSCTLERGGGANEKMYVLINTKKK